MDMVTDGIETAFVFLAAIGGFAALVIIVSGLLDLATRRDLRTQLGLGNIDLRLLIPGVLLWVVLFLLLLVGLIGLIWTSLAQGIPQDAEARTRALFNVLRIAGLTTVLGAVVALPFTLIRLRLNAEQTKTATESLFNDKINAAAADLHAQRQVTKAVAPGGSYRLHQDFWEDDITRRNIAIVRLRSLAEEYPAEATKVADILLSYLRNS